MSLVGCATLWPWLEPVEMLVQPYKFVLNVLPKAKGQNLLSADSCRNLRGKAALRKLALLNSVRGDGSMKITGRSCMSYARRGGGEGVADRSKQENIDHEIDRKSAVNCRAMRQECFERKAILSLYPLICCIDNSPCTISPSCSRRSANKGTGSCRTRGLLLGRNCTLWYTSGPTYRTRKTGGETEWHPYFNANRFNPQCTIKDSAWTEAYHKLEKFCWMNAEYK